MSELTFIADSISTGCGWDKEVVRASVDGKAE